MNLVQLIVIDMFDYLPGFHTPQFITSTSCKVFMDYLLRSDIRLDFRSLTLLDFEKLQPLKFGMSSLVRTRACDRGFLIIKTAMSGRHKRCKPRNVQFISDLSYNLLSVPVVILKEYSVIFIGNVRQIEKNGITIAEDFFERWTSYFVQRL